MQTNPEKSAVDEAGQSPILKYDHQLDFRSPNNSHVQLLGRVPDGAEVLELGCATGYMSAYLVERKHCRVVGVDNDAAALEKAARHCERTLCVDVETADWQALLGEQRFDVVLCADIIEHLKDPLRFLAGLGGLLKEGGRLLASVPNGAHVSIRLELLQGQLTYEETGLLDRTHLHLFTHRSLMALVARAGYVVEGLSYTFHDIPDQVIEDKLVRAGLVPNADVLARLHAPEAVAYQFIVEARPLLPGEDAHPVPELTDKPLRDSEELYRKVHERLHQTQLVAQNRQELIEARDRQLAASERHSREQGERIGQLTQLNNELGKRLAHEDGRVTELRQQLHLLDARVTALVAEQTARQGEVTRQQAEIKRQQNVLKHLREHNQALERVLSTRSWRLFRALTLPARAAVRLAPHLGYLLRNPGVAPRWAGKALRLLRQGGVSGLRWHLTSASQVQPTPLAPSYERWIRECELPTEPDKDSVRGFVATLQEPPLLSLVMPVYEPRPEWLRPAIQSVLDQSYPHWELCIADDASPSDSIRQILREFSRLDPRVKVTFREQNGHIAAATNSALALAQGQWVGFLDHDDLLAPNALYHVAVELAAHPQTRLLYSDEDKIDADGVRHAHYFKPDFNPDLMLAHNMLCHFSVYRRDLIEQVGGLREGFEGAQDYDLALRCLAVVKPGEVRHVARVLYHWRAVTGSTASGIESKPYALDAAVRAVSAYLEAQGVQAEVGPSPKIEGMLRVRYPVPEPAPLVSVIIPTRNGLDLLRQCIESLRAKTDYPNYEIIVVDNQSDDPATLDYLADLQQRGLARVLRYDAPFNYSSINNFAVGESAGDYLCFLNNDIEVTDGAWLAEMVSQAARPAVGAVGARLLYPDGRLQHGGVITGLGGVAGHAMKFLSGESKGYNGRAALVQNYSAVTAACLVLRREVFEEIGGFDAEHLGVAFNDVDLCLRIRERGYRNLWTPYAELYHHESATRGPEDTAEKRARFGGEIAYMKSRWGDSLLRDPAYNPNLTLDREDFSLNWHLAQIRKTA